MQCSTWCPASLWAKTDGFEVLHGFSECRFYLWSWSGSNKQTSNLKSTYPEARLEEKGAPIKWFLVNIYSDYRSSMQFVQVPCAVLRITNMRVFVFIKPASFNSDLTQKKLLQETEMKHFLSVIAWKCSREAFLWPINSCIWTFICPMPWKEKHGHLLLSAQQEGYYRFTIIVIMERSFSPELHLNETVRKQAGKNLHLWPLRCSVRTVAVSLC